MSAKSEREKARGSVTTTRAQPSENVGDGDDVTVRVIRVCVVSGLIRMRVMD